MEFQPCRSADGRRSPCRRDFKTQWRIDPDPDISGRGNEDHPLSSWKLKGLPGSADHDPGPALSVFKKNGFRESDQHDRLEDGGNG